ncbi:GNAT family N-acetyltransferase [Microbacterium sp. cx-55]|uniref:GNAT family N-acetyltransferase n=1 Tax=Microbacterium sp. cx-55 TaxID=2875948 RepID=UPI001CBF82AF|nr:GNAT family N-acetyltransferase [Microbacterium sp. cx-55]MBZ4487963.1 GNAT family N-acetyltransferase [Microbacterium sp. cx-55]UGB34627.1 GNAT family N-acetyltransferase [Microbacterium sp. cx-55]
MSRIRPFRVGDEADLADICVRTAAAGADATGALSDDGIWAEIFVLPYVARHPDTAFVVEGEGRVLGYAVAAPDTVAFEEWFRSEWWPVRAARFAREGADPREAGLLAYADARGSRVDPRAAKYPAHLHIDLLPDLQGQGFGRALIERLGETLRSRGVTGVHLVASAENTAAVGFYDRLGFTRLPSAAGEQAFGLIL